MKAPSSVFNFPVIRFFSILMILLVVQQFATAQKRQQAQIRYLEGFYYGIDEKFLDLHLEDSLAKTFGKKRAEDILRGCEVDMWPQSAFEALTQFDTVVIVNYFKQFRAWKIFDFDKNNSILEVRPEDNKFLQDTGFKKTFYIFFADRRSLAIGPWAPVTTGGMATGNDELNRKNFIATFKKKYLTPERKLRTEILKKTVKGNESIDIGTDFEENLKRMILVMTNGENNKLLIVDEDKNGKNVFIEPRATENLNGYTISRFSFYNSSKKVSLGLTEDKTADFTVLALTEKNDKAWVEYKKGVDDEKEANKKETEQNKAKLAGQYAREYQEARSRIVQILNKVDVFIRQSEWDLDWTSSHAEKDHWGWNEYNKYFKGVKDAYKMVIAAYNDNRTVVISSGNPDYGKIEAWYKNFVSQNQNIQDEINKVDQLFENSKSPDLYSYKWAYERIIGYGKKIYDHPY